MARLVKKVDRSVDYIIKDLTDLLSGSNCSSSLVNDITISIRKLSANAVNVCFLNSPFILDIEDDIESLVAEEKLKQNNFKLQLKECQEKEDDDEKNLCLATVLVQIARSENSIVEELIRLILSAFSQTLRLCTSKEIVDITYNNSQIIGSNILNCECN